MDLALHYATSLRAAEARADLSMHMQQRDPQRRDHGAYAPPTQGYVEPSHSANSAGDLLCLYLNPDSRYCDSAEVLESVQLYLQHLLAVQHDDGTLDLRCTNFHCSSTVAFTIKPFAQVWRLLDRHGEHNEMEKRVCELCWQYLRAAAEGMLNGGFHTPNHRWVLVASLSLLHRILGDGRLRAEAELYLREGIDSDEYGEYTERSVGVYNIAVNRSLLIAAEELERPDLLDCVSHNLDSVLRYWEPDDTLYTMASRRQDYGTQALPLDYYDNYLLAGLRLDNPRYLDLAGRIHDLAVARGQPVNALLLFMSRPGLRDQVLPTEPVSFSCRHHNTRAGVVRLREGDRSLSLQAGNTRFLKYQMGSNTVYLKCATTFFGDKGRFVSETIEPQPDGYRLQYSCEWGYKRPLDAAPSSSLWDDLDHASRQDVQMQQLDATVDVRWEEGAAVLDLHTRGTPEVLLKLEFIFKPGGVLSTEALRVPGLEDGHALHRSGVATYHLGCDQIHLSDGFGEHDYARPMRGSEAPDPGTFIVYMTGYTPVSRRIRISGSRGV